MEKISSFNSIRLKLNLLFKITYYILLIDQKFTKFNQNLVYKDLSNYALTSSIFNRPTKSSKNGRNYWITSTTKLEQSYRTNVCPLRNSEISNRLSWAYRRKFHGHWHYRESCYTYRHGNLRIHPLLLRQNNIFSPDDKTDTKIQSQSSRSINRCIDNRYHDQALDNLACKSFRNPVGRDLERGQKRSGRSISCWSSTTIETVDSKIFWEYRFHVYHRNGSLLLSRKRKEKEREKGYFFRSRHLEEAKRVIFEPRCRHFALRIVESRKS